MLDLYTDYLIASFAPTTATGLSRLLDGAVSHDQVIRFLFDRLKTSADLWQLVQPLRRNPTPMKTSKLLGTSMRRKIAPSKVSTFSPLSIKWARSACPVAFDLVTKTETYFDAKKQITKRRSQQSKNALYRQLLQICVHHQVKFRYVLNDSWYASADNMKFVHRNLKKDFIFASKENRKVA